MKNNKSKMISNIFSLFRFAILFIIFYLSGALSVQAQELSVSIDPSIIQIDVKEPSLIKTPLSIQNESDQSITYGIFLVPFKAGRTENGQPEYDNALTPEYRQIFKKVKVIDGDQPITQLTLAPGQKKELSLSISVSKEEQSHDYYFSVLFVSQDQEQPRGGSAVTARGGIGANVLLTVGPKATPEGSIEEFWAPSFVTGGPLNLRLKIRNKSNHFVTVKGNVIVKNIFGQSVGNLEVLPVNILSNSSRLMETENNKDSESPKIIWDEKFLLGVYKVEAEIALSDEGPLLKDTRRVIAFPLPAVLLVLLCLVLLIGVIRRARRKIS